MTFMFLRTALRSEKSKNIFYNKIENRKTKKVILFLHGIAGSRRYWDKAYHSLSDKYSLYFLDLLGFGFSAKPHTDYNLDTHVRALKRFIQEEVQEKELRIVGHSLGGIIGLAYAKKYPREIDKLYLLALPYYHSSEEAMSYVKAHTKPQYFVVDSFLTKATCTLWCYIGGPISRRIVPFFLKNLPDEVASDSLLHTYNSYISTLYNILYYQNIPSLISKTIKNKIFLIHGEKDTIAPVSNIQELANTYNLKLSVLPNLNHGFPLEAKEETVKVITNS